MVASLGKGELILISGFLINLEKACKDGVWMTWRHPQKHQCCESANNDLGSPELRGVCKSMRVHITAPISSPEEQAGSPHFTDEKIEARRNEGTSPWPQAGVGRGTWAQSLLTLVSPLLLQSE